MGSLVFETGQNLEVDEVDGRSPGQELALKVFTPLLNGMKSSPDHSRTTKSVAERRLKLDVNFLKWYVFSAENPIRALGMGGDDFRQMKRAVMCFCDGMAFWIWHQR
jgi:hypothetical protein